MAITDRNLAAGTRIWARYKGELHTAEVVEVDGAIRYRLTLNGETKDYKSPSAAAAAMFGEGRTANGWAVWSVGEPVEKPPKEPKAPRSTSVHPAPKPERKRRKPKPTTPTDTVPTDRNGHALAVIEQTTGEYECGECGASFPTTEEAAAHLAEVHPT